jgi:hypothetical protein
MLRHWSAPRMNSESSQKNRTAAPASRIRLKFHGDSGKLTAEKKAHANTALLCSDPESRGLDRIAGHVCSIEETVPQGTPRRPRQPRGNRHYETLPALQRARTPRTNFCFRYAKAGLEAKHGELQTWALKHKAAIAQEILKTAKEGYPHAPYGSCGVALVGLYLEAQTLPGDKATRLVYLIEEWQRRAIGQDVHAAR